jgi:3-oxoacyl-[acyl-carrier protein] reductase
VLVANAGTGRIEALEDVSVEDFDEAVAINLRAPFLLAQRTLPAMSGALEGSCSCPRGCAHGPDHRSALRSLQSRAARPHPLPRFSICAVTVNALAPSLIADGMFLGDPETLRQHVPVGRLGQPEDVADLAVAILANPYITNQVISIDGGIYPR